MGGRRLTYQQGRRQYPQAVLLDGAGTQREPWHRTAWPQALCNKYHDGDREASGKNTRDHHAGEGWGNSRMQKMDGPDLSNINNAAYPKRAL